MTPKEAISLAIAAQEARGLPVLGMTFIVDIEQDEADLLRGEVAVAAQPHAEVAAGLRRSKATRRDGDRVARFGPRDVAAVIIDVRVGTVTIQQVTGYMPKS